jgi:hypothetical protein
MYISQETYYAFVISIGLRMLYKERVTVYCKNYMKFIDLQYIKAGSMHKTNRL